MTTYRFVHLFLAVIALFAMLAAFYMDNYLGMAACTLCVLQRAMFALIFVVSVTAFIQNANLTMQRIYGWLNLIGSLSGLVFAARQVWLQQQPMSVAHNCLPRFSYMVENMSAQKAVELFKGTTNCSEFTWTYQGLSLASWSALLFTVIVIFVLAQLMSLRCASGTCKLD